MSFRTARTNHINHPKGKHVSRAQLSLCIHRPSDWQDRRRRRYHDDEVLIAQIVKHIAELSTYGYRRVWALLRKENEDEGAETVNVKRVYRVMRDNHLLLEMKRGSSGASFS
ncbi:IS3 family transposase [Candidatus Erwinia dacicola]